MANLGLYKLTNTTSRIEDGLVERIRSEAIDYEHYFECWLENNPSLLLDEDEGISTILWIGRQVTASVGETDKFPDLIGIDATGDVVIVELKKGKTPRDVVAQILEYASWSSRLDYSGLDELARTYFSDNEVYKGKSLKEIHQEVFNLDLSVDFEKIVNRKQKLFIVAEEVSPIVRQVSEYLREAYHMNVFHLEYEVMRTKDEQIIISIEKTFGFDRPVIDVTKHGPVSSNTRWNYSEKVKDVIHRGVLEYIQSNIVSTFTPKDIISLLKRQYPDINTSTISCQIIQDCVNHASRRHYPGGQQDLYFLVNKGVYRLYEANNDGKWNREGKRIY